MPDLLVGQSISSMLKDVSAIVAARIPKTTAGGMSPVRNRTIITMKSGSSTKLKTMIATAPAITAANQPTACRDTDPSRLPKAAPGNLAKVDQGSTIPQKSARSLVLPLVRQVHIVNKTAATRARKAKIAEARRLGCLLIVSFMFEV